MWIHWSITRLVRWRVRDWASCVTACRFPLDEEPEASGSSPPQLPMRNVVFEMKDETKRNRRGKRFLRKGKYNKNTCTKLNLSSTQARNNLVSAENKSINSEPSWHSFADEDYIVFCFREDGAFDVVKDCKSEASSRIDCTRRSSWPINQTTEEEESIDLDTKSHSSRIHRQNQSEEMVSTESSDSFQSDNSTGSFAFPVLGWEWIGSPAQWPKSEGLQLRKNKARSLTFQCCRF